VLLTAVALPVPLYRSFDYRVDAAHAARLRRGARVRVPFGSRERVGIVVGAVREAAPDAGDYRALVEVLDDPPLLPAELLGLCEWAAGYYLHPLGETVWPPSARDWWLLAGLALLSHVGGQGLIAYALAHLPAAFSSVSLLVQPVAAALFAWLLLAEAFGPLQALGGAIVLAGILLCRLSLLRSSGAMAAAPRAD
jgi:hypothetical protein